MPAKKRKREGLAASDVRIGQSIAYQGEAWSVLAPHPDSGSFWLHRWIDGDYQTTFAHVRELASIRTIGVAS